MICFLDSQKVNFNEYLKLTQKDGDWFIVCKKCGHVFCRWNENPKEYAHIKEIQLSKAGPLYFDSDRFFLRQFFCPGCATLFGNDVALKGSPILWETKLDKVE